MVDTLGLHCLGSVRLDLTELTERLVLLRSGHGGDERLKDPNYAKTRQERQLQQQQQTCSNKINNKISQLNKNQPTRADHTDYSQKTNKEVYFARI